MVKPLKANERRDIADRKKCNDAYGPILYNCFGGRWVVQGYCCPHCDSEDPVSKCYSPVEGSQGDRRKAERRKADGS